MSRWLSPNSEILILALIGLVNTVIEAMYLNLNENLHDIWKVVFPEHVLLGTLENMLKTIISGIAIARGATVHIYLASYLLLIFPVLKERRKILLLVWLTVSGFRSILINGLAAFVGIAICSCLPEPHPACFEFLTTKGAELACSVFMWVIVNDFMYYLRRKPHQSIEIIPEEDIIANPHKLLNLQKNRWPKNSLFSVQDSEESQSSVAESVNAGVHEVSEGSSDSLVAKAAVNWFFRLSLGMNKPQIFRCQSRKADRDEELAQKFLRMTPDEVERLTKKIKRILTNNAVKRERAMKLDPDQPGCSRTHKYETNTDHPDELKIKTIDPGSLGSISHSIFQDDTIIPNLPTAIEPMSLDPPELFRDVGTQTDKLPKKILKIIERQEKVMDNNSLFIPHAYK